MMARKRAGSSSPSMTRWLVMGALVAALSYGTPQLLELLPKAPFPPSATKPFSDLASFRALYQSEHQHAACVQLHVIGTSIVVFLALMHPELIAAGLVATRIGMMAFTVCRHQDHGGVEALAMVFSFFLTVKWLRGSARMALAVLLIGYAFAWIGHFVYEQNRPTTFVYPSFSLICDFMLWFEYVTGITLVL